MVRCHRWTASLAIAAGLLAACKDAPTTPRPELRLPAPLLSTASADYGLVTVLAPLSGRETDDSYALAINSTGDAVGYSVDGTRSIRATMWAGSGGTPRALEPPGTTYSINDVGDIVGGSIRSSGGSVSQRPVVWPGSGGSMRDLGTLGGGNGEARDINNAGVIVGFSEKSSLGTFRATLWPAGGGAPRDLGALPGTTVSEARAINDRGDVIGSSGGLLNAVGTLWAAGGGAPRALVGLDGLQSGVSLHAINGRGDIVGVSKSGSRLLATLWPADGGPPRELASTGATASAAFGINDAGDAVGLLYTSPTTARGVLWPAGGGASRDLGLAGDVVALAINASGQIVAVQRIPDGIGGHVTRAVRLTPPNDPPTVDIGGPYAGTEGIALAFGGVSATDPNGDALTYRWDFGDGETSLDANPTHAYADNGVYKATVTVTDRGGLSATSGTTVTVSNALPVVDAGAAASLIAGRSLAQNTTFSDPGGIDGPWRYHLDWGDGTGSNLAASVNARGALPTRSHTYWEPGTYTLIAKVTDKDGGVGMATRTVTVVPNEVPVANANGPYAADEGAPINFSSAGTTDGNGDVLRYKWDFGDGTTSSSASFTKRYADNGTYTVTLTVTDPSNVASTVTTTAVVTNVAPTGFLTAASSVNEGAAYTVSLTAQDAGTTDRLTLEFAFDCGTGVYGAWSTSAKSVTCPAHPNQLEAPLTVRGKVRDKDGAELELTKSIKIVDVTPVVVFAPTSPTAIAAGGSVSFQGSFSDPGVDDHPWTWTVNWGDGTPVESGVVTQAGDLGTFTHAYAKAGTFSPSFRVTDKDGKTKSTTTVVTVSP